MSDVNITLDLIRESLNAIAVEVATLRERLYAGPTLRDRFALAALSDMAHDVGTPEAMAKRAYALADGMLDERAARRRRDPEAPTGPVEAAAQDFARRAGGQP